RERHPAPGWAGRTRVPQPDTAGRAVPGRRPDPHRPAVAAEARPPHAAGPGDPVGGRRVGLGRGGPVGWGRGRADPPGRPAHGGDPGTAGRGRDRPPGAARRDAAVLTVPAPGGARPRRAPSGRTGTRHFRCMDPPAPPGAPDVSGSPRRRPPRPGRAAAPATGYMPTNATPTDPPPAGEDPLGALRHYCRDRNPRGPSAADLERALLHLHKQVTLGQVAAEMAHDFGNLMTVMLGYSELLLTGFGPDRPERAYVAELHRAAEQASALTAQLLRFSRQSREPSGPLDLGEVVRGLTGMFALLLGPSARLIVRAAAGRGLILADASQVEQAVVNLVLNARDALAANGRIEVAVETVRLDRPLDHALGTAPAGDYV